MHSVGSNLLINLPGIGKYRRFQYPLLPAQTCTIHKSQGMTAHNGIVLHMKNIKFEMGLAYVGLSRAKNLADIYLLTMLHPNLFTSHAKKREDVHAEYRRLRDELQSLF